MPIWYAAVNELPTSTAMQAHKALQKGGRILIVTKILLANKTELAVGPDCALPREHVTASGVTTEASGGSSRFGKKL